MRLETESIGGEDDSNIETRSQDEVILPSIRGDHFQAIQEEKAVLDPVPETVVIGLVKALESLRLSRASHILTALLLLETRTKRCRLISELKNIYEVGLDIQGDLESRTINKIALRLGHIWIPPLEEGPGEVIISAEDFGVPQEKQNSFPLTWSLIDQEDICWIAQKQFAEKKVDLVNGLNRLFQMMRMMAKLLGFCLPLDINFQMQKVDAVRPLDWIENPLLKWEPLKNSFCPRSNFESLRTQLGSNCSQISETENEDIWYRIHRHGAGPSFSVFHNIWSRGFPRQNSQPSNRSNENRAVVTFLIGRTGTISSGKQVFLKTEEMNKCQKFWSEDPSILTIKAVGYFARLIFEQARRCSDLKPIDTSALDPFWCLYEAFRFMKKNV